MATSVVAEVAIGPCVPEPLSELIHPTHIKDTVRVLIAPKVFS